MKDRVQGCVTAGVALVGVGVMAAAPVAQQAPEVLRSANADVALAAVVQGTTAELLTESGERLVGSVATAPTGLIAATQALAGGDDATGYYILKQFIDGPLYVADPTIYAFDDLLPAPLGGDEDNETTQRGDSLITQFRSDVLYQSREELGEALRDTLGLADSAQSTQFDDGVVYKASRIGFGLGESAVRGATSAVTAPLGLVAVAQGLQKSLNGDGNTDLYLALQAYIDAPNYITDPIVFAADDVTPAPVGGDPEKDPRLMDNSEITRFRGTTLLAPRDNVRNAVAGALGVNPVTGAETISVGATQLSKTATTTERTGPISRVLNSLKATPGGGASSAATSTGGKHRAAPTGGLSNLFKKPVKKTDTPADSPTESADNG